MTLRNRLLQELDDCRWFAMRQLADECEERGEVDEALGWRWLAENRRWPYPDRKNYRFLGYPEKNPGYRSRPKGDPSRLPDSVIAKMKKRSHASEAWLLALAAKAVGGWLREAGSL